MDTHDQKKNNQETDIHEGRARFDSVIRHQVQRGIDALEKLG